MERLQIAMDKKQIKEELIILKMKSGEELVGFFQANWMPSFWWVLLIGPLVFLGARTYYVGITNLGIHFNKITFFGKPAKYNYFTWDKIDNLKLGEGILTIPLKLGFSNGRKIKFNAQLKGVDKVAKLDEKTNKFLVSKAS